MPYWKKFVAIVGAVALAIAIADVSQASAATGPSAFASIDDQVCGEVSGSITISGEAPRGGNYAISVFAEDGKFHPVANEVVAAGEQVNLRTIDELIEGESVGVILTVSDPTTSDDSVQPTIVERKMVTRPSQAFCEAAIAP